MHEEKTTKQHVPTAGRDVPAAGNPKRPWTKPEIRIMKVNFTESGINIPNTVESPSNPGYLPS